VLALVLIRDYVRSFGWTMQLHLGAGSSRWRLQWPSSRRWRQDSIRLAVEQTGHGVGAQE
jgi:hypothetical protein